MPNRTLGWVQDATDIVKLKTLISVFVPNSTINLDLRNNLIPNLLDASCDKAAMINQLTADPVKVKYDLLKGRGTIRGTTRRTAPVTGIAQAVLPGQTPGRYQSDWAANSFIVWAIAIGLLEYNDTTDYCSITERGLDFATSTGQASLDVLKNALLSYPPVSRILRLLNDDPQNCLTKFEIGSHFGFIGEKGFTCFSQRFILEGLQSIGTNTIGRNQLLRNTEGTSDKYVRTICSWLVSVGWVTQQMKQVTENINGVAYTDSLRAYKLTLLGRQDLNRSSGGSRHAQIVKNVDYFMLATKAADSDYLRKRRLALIDYLSHGYHTLDECAARLRRNGIAETTQVVRDDIRGIENIGLSITHRRSDDSYCITDAINILHAPAVPVVSNKSNTTLIKDNLRQVLRSIDHRYLTLIDYGFDTPSGSNRNYELLTADLLTAELNFAGARLGDTRKPDVCVFYGNKGLIIDNKAYANGYNIPISQADEMIRYIEENQRRELTLNPNHWWDVFLPTVTDFNFSFVSGAFVGNYRSNIQHIKNRTQVDGAAIDSANLLLLADAIKSGDISYYEALDKFRINDLISIQVP